MASTASNADVTSASLKTFVTALVLNGAIFAIELLLFTVVRKKFKAIYEPRTYIPDEGKRSPPLPDNIWAWPMAVYNADYSVVKHQNGMDAYVFLRYLRMMIEIFLPIWIISWPVLLPVTSVKATGGLKQLEMFTFGNIGPDQKPRYAAHVVLSWIFTGYILYILQREMRHFVETRQRFLISPEHAASAQANTVLITGVPLRYLSESALTRLFKHFPGGVAKVWINHNLKELPDLYDARLKACNVLESAEVQLIKTAVKLSNKSGGEPKKAGTERPESGLAEILVPRNKRPTRRLPIGPLPFSLPLIGKKVDSIEWAREEILRTNDALNRGREVLENEDLAGPSSGKQVEYPPESSAFILFNTQIAAHMAAQTLIHQSPYQMAAKYTEVAPADVIWANLNMNPYEQKVRTAISYAATGALIIFWAIPVTFVGNLSNVVTQCNTSWLAWLCKIPSVVQGLIQGVLPPVLLAILNMLLPIVLRLLARFEGVPRRTGLELSLMTRFFIFQVVHNFLILTIASGVTSALTQLVNNPGSAATTLGAKLPSGSTFFMTYVILQGLTGSAAGFLQIVPLVVYYAKLFILGSTPRSIYSIKYDLRDVAWGTLFPSMTLITVIATAYMIISPIMSGIAVVAFFLFYMMWKYLFLYQLDQPQSGDTGGLFFPKAIQHTFVGLYVQQLCLAVLFFLKSAFPEGIVTIALIVVTIFCNVVLNDSFGPLLHPLPLTYANRGDGGKEGHDDEDESLAETEAQRFGGTRDIVEDKRREQYAEENGGGGVAGDRQPAELNTGTVGQAADAYGASVPTEGKRNEGPTDFNHPASVEPQRIIWVPNDPLGLGLSEVEQMRSLGLEASTENATMDEKGHTEIQGHPPGMKGPTSAAAEDIIYAADDS